ncbi:MAG: hypothetical protein CMJ64_04435 [Planctomycetaceae bacterium]|nr:hypothetical protein [Planctomycetaceae bacterium]
MDRRELLAATAAGVASSALLTGMTMAAPQKPKPKSVAAIITAYEEGLHADVMIGKILEGWKQDGGSGPALKLSSMYVEQFTDKDLARGMSKKYGVPIFKTIEEALTVGGDHIPVDGVISIGEHGTYPYNDKGQHLYPRRRFFEEITDAFKKYDRVVPVFNDKHLGPAWSDAKWMYDRARDMKVPFMAGSSLAVTYRKPEIDVPMGCEIESAVAVGYSGLDIYGIHALEGYQCLVERRQNAERGVEWVQCLEGSAVWRAVDDGLVDKDALDAAMAVVPPSGGADIREDEQAALFLFKYRDGLIGALLMLPTVGTGTAVGLKLKGQQQAIATWFEERPTPRHPHFAYLLKGIERMMHTGQPSYPVERTLLTAGILDRSLTSRFEDHKKLLTPELAIQYNPVDYPHAPNPDLESDPRRG